MTPVAVKAACAEDKDQPKVEAKVESKIDAPALHQPKGSGYLTYTWNQYLSAAEEIAISLEPGASSIRNQFGGRVVEIIPSGAITRVTVDVAGTPFIAALTSRSVEELRLAIGREVVVAFKATAVHLC